MNEPALSYPEGADAPVVSRHHVAVDARLTRQGSLDHGRCCTVYTSVYSSRALRVGHAKSDRNLHARGFDFEFATQVFEGPTLEREDTRRDYGERRVVAIGVADGILLTVVYTDRAEAGVRVRRIISARVSNRRERQAYEEAVQPGS